MNGRVYDPAIARFITADPILQDPMNGQSYNRYSYVLNNPTNLTDPTGFTGCPASDTECAGGGPEDKEKKKQEKEKGTDPCRQPGVTCTHENGVKTVMSIDGESFTVIGAEVKANVTQRAKGSTKSANSGPSITEQLKTGYAGGHRSVMWPETTAETVGRYAHNLVDFGIGLLPGSSLPQVGAEAGQGNYGTAVLLLGTELLGPFGKGARAVGAVEKAAALDAKPVLIGGGATLDQLTAGELLRIQNAANKSGVEITVVGSRVNPNSVLHAASDYDYVIRANNKIRSDLKGSLPGAKNVREGLPAI
jgi:hypothetical protein